MIDLDAYFDRIGYNGPRDQSLATLRALHALHPAAIPFENLDPLLGRPVSLAIADVAEKLIASRRGGYCFEQNTLFRAVLETLGFPVTGLAARVVWMAPPERPMAARTHMLLRVAVEGEDYIADVGFGGLLQDAPLRLITGIEQRTPSETARYVQTGGSWQRETRIAGIWQRVYVFTLEPQVEADYAVANWFTSAHPASLFRNHLLMERLQPGLRTSLSNRKFTRRFADGRIDRRDLTDAADLWRVMTEEMEIAPPDEAHVLFDRLPSS